MVFVTEWTAPRRVMEAARIFKSDGARSAAAFIANIASTDEINLSSPPNFALMKYR
jgi:hypothetical protein